MTSDDMTAPLNLAIENLQSRSAWLTVAFSDLSTEQIEQVTAMEAAMVMAPANVFDQRDRMDAKIRELLSECAYLRAALTVDPATEVHLPTDMGSAVLRVERYLELRAIEQKAGAVYAPQAGEDWHVRIGPALALVTATVTEVTPRTVCMFDHGNPDGTASRFALRDLEFVERIGAGDEQATRTHDTSVQD
jgi:hypothetical protein